MKRVLAVILCMILSVNMCSCGSNDSSKTDFVKETDSSQSEIKQNENNALIDDKTQNDVQENKTQEKTLEELISGWYSGPLFKFVLFPDRTGWAVNNWGNLYDIAYKFGEKPSIYITLYTYGTYVGSYDLTAGVIMLENGSGGNDVYIKDPDEWESAYAEYQDKRNKSTSDKNGTLTQSIPVHDTVPGTDTQTESTTSSSEPAILSNTDFPILVYTLENINIRKGPGKNNAKEGKVYADSIITLYESQKIGDEYTWYRVNAYADHWIADNGQWIRKLNSQEEEIYKNSLFADYVDYFPSEGSLYKVAESFDSYYWIWTGEGGCGVLIQSKDNPSSVVNESQSYDLLYDLYDKNDRKPVHFYQIYDNGRMPLKDADGQYEGVEWHVVREGKDIAYTYIYFEEIDMVKDVVEGASDQALKAKGYERIR